MAGREQIYVREAFATNWLSTVGPNLTAFEQEFSTRIGLPVVALASGTAALHLALRLPGVGPGDEVLCSTLTFVAAANAIVYQGGVPVLVDSDRATRNLDSDVLSRALRERAAANRLPKALVVVHLYGQHSNADQSWLRL
jgi:pyridoxal phosphate-dependent aminotransferase EpsN